MTDKEILDYCKSTNNRLKALRMRREELPNDKAGDKKWESIKDEILSIDKEVTDKLNKPGWEAKDVNIQLAFMDLVMDAIKDEQYYMPKY